MVLDPLGSTKKNWIVNLDTDFQDKGRWEGTWAQWEFKDKKAQDDESALLKNIITNFTNLIDFVYDLILTLHIEEVDAWALVVLLLCLWI